MFANDSGALCGDEGKEHHMMLIQGSSDATDYREGQAAGVTGQPHSSNDGEEKENADISADGKEEVKGDAQESPRYRLLKMAETVLNYCQLQMASETRCVRDTAYFRGTVAHLRSIFDKECAEERSHIEKLAEFSKMVHDMEQKYYAMKEKAKDLLVACRDEREKSEADYTAAVTRLQDIETELFSAQAIYSDQQKELAALKEASGQQISPIEVEKLRQQVAELEEKNKELGKEKAILERKIQEVQKSLTMVSVDESKGLSRNDGCGHKIGYMQTLEQAVRSMERKMEEQGNERAELLEREKEHARILKEEAAHLLKICEESQCCRTSV